MIRTIAALLCVWSTVALADCQPTNVGVSLCAVAGLTPTNQSITSFDVAPDVIGGADVRAFVNVFVHGPQFKSKLTYDEFVARERATFTTIDTFEAIGSTTFMLDDMTVAKTTLRSDLLDFERPKYAADYKWVAQMFVDTPIKFMTVVAVADGAIDRDTFEAFALHSLQIVQKDS
ncbi:hypothetical protein [Shimia ponticola]|uniref:hypothetical protein n=1 Tax=Shimia ponticola TaxID=2582893 RepID=UPI0011BD55B4|nr:hypothetical protein [Shimia ponticola]